MLGQPEAGAHLGAPRGPEVARGREGHQGGIAEIRVQQGALGQEAPDLIGVELLGQPSVVLYARLSDALKRVVPMVGVARALAAFAAEAIGCELVHAPWGEGTDVGHLSRVQAQGPWLC